MSEPVQDQRCQLCVRCHVKRPVHQLDVLPGNRFRCCRVAHCDALLATAPQTSAEPQNSRRTA